MFPKDKEFIARFIDSFLKNTALTPEQRETLVSLRQDVTPPKEQAPEACPAE